MNRAEHDALITATIAGLLCVMLIRYVAEAMNQNLGDHFDTIVACLIVALFFCGGVIGAWLEIHASRSRP